jgi:hypothetical protein
MKCVPYVNVGKDFWSDICHSSDDAWFWHSWDWMKYAELYVGNDLIYNCSFAILSDDRFIAVQSCFVEQRAADRVLGFNKEQIFWPAIRSDIPSSKRRDLQDLCFEKFKDIANEFDVSRIELVNSVLAKVSYSSSFPPVNLPARYGYVSSMVDTLVIDLRHSLEEIWKKITKGHKSAIRTGEKKYLVRHHTKETFVDAFAVYRRLHEKAAGRVTRLPETFDMMFSWLQAGRAILFTAEDLQSAQVVGSSFFIVEKSAAYYASACKDPELEKNSPVGHILMWAAINKLKEMNFHILELGPQVYASSGTSDLKAVGISTFKRGFGGAAIPRYLAYRDVRSTSRE